MAGFLRTLSLGVLGCGAILAGVWVVPAAQDYLAWRAVHQTDRLDGYQAFLSAHPDSRWRGDASIRADELVQAKLDAALDPFLAGAKGSPEGKAATAAVIRSEGAGVGHAFIGVNLVGDDGQAERGINKEFKASVVRNGLSSILGLSTYHVASDMGMPRPPRAQVTAEVLSDGALRVTLEYSGSVRLTREFPAPPPSPRHGLPSYQWDQVAQSDRERGWLGKQAGVILGVLGLEEEAGQ